LQRRFQGREIRRDRLPHDTEIDAEVLVNQDVPHGWRYPSTELLLAIRQNPRHPMADSLADDSRLRTTSSIVFSSD